jgi:hypothetical protein
LHLTQVRQNEIARIRDQIRASHFPAPVDYLGRFEIARLQGASWSQCDHLAMVLTPRVALVIHALALPVNFRRLRREYLVLDEFGPAELRVDSLLLSQLERANLAPSAKLLARAICLQQTVH